MKSRLFLPALACFFAVVFAAFFAWQTPGLFGSRLGPAEIDRYLAAIGAQLPMPDVERESLLGRVRAWAEADDGGPVYMLNLMRYHDELRRFPGAPAFDGTPKESNAHYEGAVMSMLFGVGGYPMIAGRVTGPNVVGGDEAGLDRWSRVLVVRYPSRRAFLELLADPAYAPIEPFKFMALQVVLVPVAAETLIPDARLLVGLLLTMLFLGVGWLRAARR